MADLATLALEIDSSSVPAGVRHLDALAAAAGRTDKAVSAMASTTRTATQRMARDIDQAQRLTAGMSAVGGPALANQMANERMLRGMSQSSQAATQTMEAGLQRVARQSQLTGRDLAFMGFQFQDILVTAAMGMNPLMIALQQGTQLTQVFTMRGMSLGQALREIGPSVLAFVLNPFLLATVAAGAFALALVKIGSLFRSDIQPGAELLKQHEERVRALKEAYGEAGEAVKLYADQLPRLAGFAVERNLGDIQRRLRMHATEILQNLMIPAQLDVSPLGESTARIVAGLRNSIPDVIAYRNALIDVANAFPDDLSLQKQIDEIMKATAEAEKLQRALEGVRATTHRMAEDESMRAFRGFREALGVRLEQLEEEQQLAIRGMRPRPSVAERGDIAAEQERLRLRGEAVSAEEREIRIANARERAVVQAETSIHEATEGRLRSMQQSLRQGELEFGLIGRTVQEATRLRVEYQLMAAAIEAARQAGGVVSEEEAARIREVAAATGELARRTAELNLMRDALFKREQMGRTPFEQGLFSTLRSAGLDPNSAAAQEWMAVERLNEQLRTTQELAKDVFKGFISDLRQGTSLSEALVNALNRIADKLLDLATDQIFAMLFAPRGGGAAAGLPVAAGGVLPQIGAAAGAAGGGGGALGWLGVLLGGAGGLRFGVPRTGAPPWSAAGVPSVNLPNPPTGMGPGSGIAGGGPRALLDMIMRAEGTAAPRRGYNETLDYGRWTGGDVNLTGMTLDQVAALQARMRTPANRALYPGGGSSAVGAYQITGRTMMDLRGRMGLSGRETFDQGMQDAMAIQLAQQRISSGQGLAGMREEWVGLGRIPDAELQAAMQQFQQTQTQMTAATQQFTSGFESNLSTLTDTMGQSVNVFGGNFSGALQNLLSWVSGGGGGLSLEAFMGIGGGLGAGLFDRGGWVRSTSGIPLGPRHRLIATEVGEHVASRAMVAEASSGRSRREGGATIVQIVDQRRGGEQIQERRERTSRGDELVRFIVRDEISGGGADRPMASRYGQRPVTPRRT